MWDHDQYMTRVQRGVRGRDQEMRDVTPDSHEINEGQSIAHQPAAFTHSDLTTSFGPSPFLGHLGGFVRDPAIRLAALMEIPVIYTFTHDSIGVVRTAQRTGRSSTRSRRGRSMPMFGASGPLKYLQRKFGLEPQHIDAAAKAALAANP